MIQRYLILIDENPQKDTLQSICNTLGKEGIDLVCKEYNPTEYSKRDLDGNLDFDKERFEMDIQSLHFFKSANIILCDYNLIEGIINGYDIIKIIRDLKYSPKRKIILYSARIDDVISEILKDEKDFERQKESLTNLIGYNIEFIRRDGYDQEVFKFIRKEPDFDFETELVKWFHKRDKDEFNYLFPKYKGKSFGEIAIELESKTTDSIEFKKDLVEQIIAYLSTINNLKND